MKLIGMILQAAAKLIYIYIYIQKNNSVMLTHCQ